MGRPPHSPELYRAGRGASARGGTANRHPHRHAEDEARSWMISWAGPTVLVSFVSLPRSTRQVDSAGFHCECPAWRCEHPSPRPPVWHTGELRSVRVGRVGRVAAGPMRDDAPLRHVCLHLFWPSALRRRAACLPASKPGARRSPVWRVASILRWLLALAPASPRVNVRIQARVWSGGKWERTQSREGPSGQPVNPGEPLPGSFWAWVSATVKPGWRPLFREGQMERFAEQTPASRFPGSGRSVRPWRAHGAGA
jgi:hypothetical protein